ncbi:hypothetical protein Pcinc_020947, partial [Petrolisthes cinctipes]
MYSNVSDELGRLHISHSTPPHYSPTGGGRKVAPLVPPKPRKPGGALLTQEAELGLTALYSNIGQGGSVTHSGVQDYYAVNSPAPGTVGVASARINHAYTGGSSSSSSSNSGNNPGVIGSRDKPIAAGQDFSGVVIPGAVYTSSTGQVPAGGLGHNPNYTPPPPQPAHSYTPTSRMAVPMSAQPLYSNT